MIEKTFVVNIKYSEGDEAIYEERIARFITDSAKEEDYDMDVWDIDVEEIAQ